MTAVALPQDITIRSFGMEGSPFETYVMMPTEPSLMRRVIFKLSKEVIASFSVAMHSALTRRGRAPVRY